MTNIITIITVKYYKHLVITETLTLERMEGSAEMTAERDFIAFVLMATALSVSTLRICEQHKLKIISWILLQLVTLKVSHAKQAIIDNYYQNVFSWFGGECISICIWSSYLAQISIKALRKWSRWSKISCDQHCLLIVQTIVRRSARQNILICNQKL